MLQGKKNKTKVEGDVGDAVKWGKAGKRHEVEQVCREREGRARERAQWDSTSRSPGRPLGVRTQAHVRGARVGGEARRVRGDDTCYGLSGVPSDANVGASLSPGWHLEMRTLGGLRDGGGHEGGGPQG